MNTRTDRWVAVAAIAAFILGARLSRVIDPGVRVERKMLTTNTPALRIFPATASPHPIALLAHGNLASKEMMFRFGEALATAGFDCYSVDQPGFAESPQRCSLTNLLLKIPALERVLGGVDVFIGHSMGGELGAWSVRKFGFRPKLFIGVGAAGALGEHAPPELLLAGLFEEFSRPARFRSHTNAQAVISPWSDHALESFDPVLVRAAVTAACATVGKPVPGAPTAWRWRFTGLVLGIAGALILMFRLPELHPRLARMRGWIVPGVLLLAIILTTGTWLGMTPQLRRIPLQLVLMGVMWLTLAGLSRLRMPRWSLPVITGILTLGSVPLYIAYANPTNFFPPVMLMIILGASTVSLLAAAAVGRIAAQGGSKRDGDVAMAIFASYGIGQIMPFFF